MKTYIVTYCYLCEDTFEIVAHNKEEAIEAAKEFTAEVETRIIRRFAHKATLKKEDQIK